MLLRTLHAQRLALAPMVSSFERVRHVLGAESDLSLPQMMALGAFALDLQPRLVLDLGTGYGNSSAVFLMTTRRRGGCAVHTFDIKPYWANDAMPRLRTISGEPWSQIQAHCGDLRTIDFAPIVAGFEPVLMFWDAHGIAIADHVLGHIMPLIANRRHLVVCHDISDNRFLGDWHKGYHGRRFWRGSNDWDTGGERTAYLNLGWLCATVEQIVPLVDFSWRNDMKIESADFNFWSSENGAPKRDEVIRDLALAADTRFHLAYFTMNETASRRFPSPVRPSDV